MPLQSLHTINSNFAGKIDLTIVSRSDRGNIELLHDKTGYLMVSIKNKSFSNRLIEHFCEFTNTHLDRSFITLVDTPYINNIYANHHDAETQSKELKKLKTIAEESNRRLHRILGKHNNSHVSLLSWQQLEHQTPTWLKDEITAAFDNRGIFYRDILARTQEVIPHCTDEKSLQMFSQFLLSELPVLCYIYYLSGDQIVDIYPGEQPSLFWKIESGQYADELPQLSALTRDHAGLIYIDFRIMQNNCSSAA